MIIFAFDGKAEITASHTRQIKIHVAEPTTFSGHEGENISARWLLGKRFCTLIYFGRDEGIRLRLIFTGDAEGLGGG